MFNARFTNAAVSVDNLENSSEIVICMLLLKAITHHPIQFTKPRTHEYRESLPR